MTKRLLFIFFIVVNLNHYAQVNFPEVFPKELINKVVCGHVEVYAKNYFSGKTDYTMSTDFDYKIFISEVEGIYVEYNYGERWNDPSRFGTTQKITTFDFWKKEDKYMTDKYGDITSEWTVYHYKVYPNYQDKHYIKELRIISEKNGKRTLSLTINVPSHQDANITAALESYDVKSKTTVSNICDRIKTKKEIDFEFQENQRRILNENINKLNAVNSAIQKGDFELAQNIYKSIDLNLNYSNENKNQLNSAKKQINDYVSSIPILDSMTIVNINAAINKKDTMAAFDLYRSLKLEKSKKQINPTVINLVNKYCYTHTLDISTDNMLQMSIMKSIINKTKLSQVKSSGFYKINISGEGKVFINSEATNVTIEPIKQQFLNFTVVRPVNFEAYVSSEISTKLEYVLNVSEELKIIPEKELLENCYTYSASFSKIIENDQWPIIYYSKTKLAANFTNLTNEITTINYDKEIKGNRYKLSEVKMTYFYFRDLKINSTVFKIVVQDKKAVKFASPKYL